MTEQTANITGQRACSLVPNFMDQYLETRRLVLKPRTLDDIDDCIAMDRDPLVTQFIDGPWDNSEAHRFFVLERMRQSYPAPFGYWSIFPDDDLNNFLGWVMVLPVNTPTMCAEIGWRLTRKTWGKGIATEATAKVLAMVFKSAPGIKIIASIHPKNTGSINVAKKLGMHYTREEFADGQPQRVYAVSGSTPKDIE